MVFLADFSLQGRDKLEHYLAYIVSVLRTFMSGFSKDPKGYSVDECLLEFAIEQLDRPRTEREKLQDPHEAKMLEGMSRHKLETRTMRQESPPNTDVAVAPSERKQWIETGEGLVIDPKWSRVNANAKMVWMQRLGIDRLVEGEIWPDKTTEK